MLVSASLSPASPVLVGFGEGNCGKDRSAGYALAGLYGEILATSFRSRGGNIHARCITGLFYKAGIWPYIFWTLMAVFVFLKVLKGWRWS